MIDSRYFDWPSDPWVLASYAFPKPGEITSIGPTLRAGIGPLHFAGKHMCYAFIGYMEGALQSGIAVAKKNCQALSCSALGAFERTGRWGTRTTPSSAGYFFAPSLSPIRNVIGTERDW